MKEQWDILEKLGALEAHMKEPCVMHLYSNGRGIVRGDFTWFTIDFKNFQELREKIYRKIHNYGNTN